jgi:hypothetical protein
VFTAVSARLEHLETLTVCFSEGNRADPTMCLGALQNCFPRLESILPANSLYPLP